jgi:short-subunit dehydrogenase
LETPFCVRYGPWALVAGASAGLGAAFARDLAARGLDLVLIARGAAALTELAAGLREAHGVGVRTLALDLAAAGTPDAIMAATADLDVGLLVYNASYSAIGPFAERSLGEHLREIDTNVRCPLALAHVFASRLAGRRRGGLLLMSSLSAWQGSALIANYAATKAYNLILAEGLWEELRHKGVDVLACCAGATLTPNYLASLRGHAAVGVPALAPEAVVSEALGALGRQSQVIPGYRNRLAHLVMHRLLPRPVAVRLMARVLRRLYA